MKNSFQLALKSIQMFPEQIKQAWKEVNQSKIPSDFKKAKNIIIAGMGGSALGARIIDSLKFENLKIPLEVITGYQLPAYADQDSLVIISSYSGNTEEPLNCFHQAIEKKCRLWAITTGGQLAELVKKNKIPAYIFQPQFNPSQQPRLGIIYSVIGQMAFLAKAGLINLDEIAIKEAIAELKKTSIQEPAQSLAAKLQNKIVIIISAEHLNGTAHAFKNMLNENSKTFSVRFSLPELNHHLLEGLSYPQTNKKNLKFLTLESDFYDDQIKKRMAVTKKVIVKNDLTWEAIKIEGKNRLIEVLGTLQLAGFVSLYLAEIYKIDPLTIPWVDFFKKELKK